MLNTHNKYLVFRWFAILLVLFVFIPIHYSRADEYSLGTLTLGLRTHDFFSAQYTLFPGDFTSAAFGNLGPQIGILNFKKREMFYGIGGWVAAMGTLAAQFGIRQLEDKSVLTHLQAGIGFFIFDGFIALESNFNSDHRVAIGIEMHIPMGRFSKPNKPIEIPPPKGRTYFLNK
jgi:hypothetical protein